MLSQEISYLGQFYRNTRTIVDPSSLITFTRDPAFAGCYVKGGRLRYPVS